jgi:hypothetical protein
MKVVNIALIKSVGGDIESLQELTEDEYLAGIDIPAGNEAIKQCSQPGGGGIAVRLSEGLSTGYKTFLVAEF